MFDLDPIEEEICSTSLCPYDLEISYSGDFQDFHDDLLDIIAKKHKLAYWKLDLTTSEVVWSRGVFEIYGMEYSEKPIPLETALGLYQEQDANRLASIIEQAIIDNQSFHAILKAQRIDSSNLIVEVYGRVISDENDSPVHLIGTFQNITSANRIKVQQKSNLTLIQAILNSEFNANAIVDRELKYVAASDGYLESYDLTSHENIIGLPLPSVIFEAPDEMLDSLSKALEGTETEQITYKWSNALGFSVEVVSKLKPWYAPDGTIAGVLINDHVEKRYGEIDIGNKQISPSKSTTLEILKRWQSEKVV